MSSAQQGWVSVDEALPEDGTWVLVVPSTRRTTLAFYSECGAERHWWALNSNEWEGVTHWMPLPEPPLTP